MGRIVMPVLLILVLYLVFSNIRIVPQEHAYIIERLGKFKAVWYAGLHLKIPFFDRIVNKISLKEQVFDFPPQPVITKDNVSVKVDSVVFSKVFDPQKYTYGVENPIAGLQNLSATTLRSIIGGMELDTTLSSRESINSQMEAILDEATDPWGIKVNRVELKNIDPPAEIEEVLPVEDDPNSLLVVVSPDQLSLAIGKKGKNAKLAVRLTDRKIDIKTKDEIIASGKDYDELVAKAEAQRAERRREIERREIARMEAEARAAEEKRQAAVEALARKVADEAAAAAAAEDVLPEEMQENMSERIRNEMAREIEHPSETPVSEPEPVSVAEEPEPEAVSEPEVEIPSAAAEEKEPEEEPVKAEEEPVVVKETKKRVDLEEVAAKNDYVSRFEKLADTTKPKQAAPAKKRRRKGDDDGIKTRNDELLRQLKKDGTEISKPIYTDEELDEIERQAQEEEDAMYDIDYDEYEEYYEE